MGGAAGAGGVEHPPLHLDCAGGPRTGSGASVAVVVFEDAGERGAGVGGGGAGTRGVIRAVAHVGVVLIGHHAVGVPLRGGLIAGRVGPERPDVVDATLGVAANRGGGPDVVGDAAEAGEIRVVDEDRCPAA